jgi:hypothetical protein
MDIEKIFAIINTIGLLVLGFLQWRNQSRQVDSQSDVGEADAAQKITNSATSLVQQLQNELTALRPMVGRLAQLEAEVSNLRKANDRLINWAERLVKQIEVAGLDPVPFRPDAESDRIKTLPIERKT